MTNDAPDQHWILRLYIAGMTPTAVRAVSNIRAICRETLDGDKFELEVIDLLSNPELAEAHQIVAVPTLVRQLPVPLRKIIGDLSDKERVIVGLDLQPLK